MFSMNRATATMSGTIRERNMPWAQVLGRAESQSNGLRRHGKALAIALHATHMCGSHFPRGDLRFAAENVQNNGLAR
jgi:hypothetical protein